MAVMDLAASQRGCWRKIAITLIDMIVSGIVTLDGAKNHRQQPSGKTTICLEEPKLNTTSWQPGPA
jgi:hypothetical protein